MSGLRMLGAAASILCGMAGATAASAAVLTFQTNFSATFANAPAAQASGALKITYNTTTRVSTLDTFKMIVGTQTYLTEDVVFNLANLVQVGPVTWPLFLIGGKINGQNAAAGTNDFTMSYNGASRTIDDLTYMTAGTRGLYARNAITLGAYDPSQIATPSPAAVPDAASWMLFVAGFGLVGGRARRRSHEARPGGVPARG